MEDQEKEKQRTRITDSKNVVNGSNIEGQNIHIGDIIHQHTSSTPLVGQKGQEDTEAIRQLIAKGKLKQAMEALAGFAKGKGDNDATDQVNLLKSQWAAFNKQNRMRLLSYEDSTLQRNKITHSMLELLREFDE
ncbi:MAG: hypothetical protein RIC19_11170 [Phaeodactylibacter sp.]|uniref:hypothetical protein n=1 Tax=Phaeodactylibacter sp. TaxID=1940289 RepID=UPI0032EACFDD